MNENEKIEISDTLLMGYINNELDSPTNTVVSRWIEASHANAEHYGSLLKAWEIAGKIEPKPVVVDTDLAWNNVAREIAKKDGKIIPINHVFKRRMYLSIAASVVVLFGVIGWLKYSGAGELEYTTFVAAESGLVDDLPDGSVVTFNANTSLVYPVEFGNDERRVRLNGEAFFDIQRNEEKPFIIELPQDNYVKVLGTSFNIKAAEGDSLTEVYVSTGKVEFGSGESTIILVAGQKGIYNRNSGELIMDESPTAGIEDMFWKDEIVRFNSIPLHEAIAIVNLIAGDSLIFDCSLIEEPLIHSSYLKNESMEKFLVSLRETHGIDYTKTQHGKYRIECNEN